MPSAGGDAPEDELWVDKYAPRSFLELLSDESINRGVVRWLKSWDAVVFGTGQAAAAASRSGGPVQGGGRQGKPPEDRRPAQRVLLMGGPPGLSCDCRSLRTVCPGRKSGDSSTRCQTCSGCPSPDDLGRLFLSAIC